MSNSKQAASIVVPVLLVVLAGGLFGHAAADEPRDADRAALQSVVDRLSAAWRAGDANAWAAEFADDADFTVWFGMSLEGADEIARGHRLIFDTFYANTSFDLEVRRLRFLGDTAAVAHLAGAVLADGEQPPAEPDAVPIAVFQKVGNEWKIVAFQNTPFAVDEFRTNGNLDLFKRLAAEQMKALRPAAPVLE